MKRAQEFVNEKIAGYSLSTLVKMSQRQQDEAEAILKHMPIGEIYTLIQDLGHATFDQLASAAGRNRLHVSRAARKLAETGIVEIRGNEVIYRGQKSM